MYTPRQVFLTKGVGKHREKLASFEDALRSAKIAAQNIVKVSSIFPPGARLISSKKGLEMLEPGAITYVVISHNETCEPHRLIAASVGVAIPTDRNMYGYLSEHHSYGEKADVAGDYAEDLAASMLATIQGVDFDPDISWDEKKEIWRISGKIFKTSHITQTAIGNKQGLWTTVVAAAVLIP